jgi:hypothetical protein
MLQTHGVFRWIAALVTASAAALLVAAACSDADTAPSGRPLTYALLNTVLKLAEALTCLALAWFVWHDRTTR